MATVLVIQPGEELEFEHTTITFYICMRENSTLILRDGVVM